MASVLKVVDELIGASTPARRAGVQLWLASARVSAREIIRSRVTAEVEEINRRRAEVGPTRSYIVPIGYDSPEARLNARLPKSLNLDAEIDRAITAFARKRFIMLLDDRQIGDLDESIGLRPESEVVFVHLTPLKGG